MEFSFLKERFYKQVHVLYNPEHLLDILVSKRGSWSELSRSLVLGSSVCGFGGVWRCSAPFGRGAALHTRRSAPPSRPHSLSSQSRPAQKARRGRRVVADGHSPPPSPTPPPGHRPPCLNRVGALWSGRLPPSLPPLLLLRSGQQFGPWMLDDRSRSCGQV